MLQDNIPKIMDMMVINIFEMIQIRQSYQATIFSAERRQRRKQSLPVKAVSQRIISGLNK